MIPRAPSTQPSASRRDLPGGSAPYDQPAAPPGSLAGLGYDRMAWLHSGTDQGRRQCARRSLRCPVLLLECGEHDVRPRAIPGECLDVSDGGLYAAVPIGYGVAAGQRHTFQLTIGENGPEPGLGQIVTQQGIILRTELLIETGGRGDRVGIAVRLIGPRAGVIPMPQLD